MVQRWRSQLGSQRDWVWRGWQVRYTYIRATTPVGQTPPFLFLHGFASSLAQWQENLTPLSQANTVYAMDLVGFGASEKAAAPYNIGFWVDQVYDFWRTFIGQPIVLVGHSLGALVALTAAVTYPEMVNHLVLLTLPAARQELLSGPFQSWVGEVESFFASPLLIKPLFYLIRRPGIIRAVLRAIYSNPDRVTENLVADFLAPGYDRGAARTLVLLTKARTQNDFSATTKEMLPQVRVPILLLWGRDDRVIPLPWDKQYPSLNPNLKLVEIPQAGHCLYDEAADRVNAEILAWLGVQERAQV